MIEVRHLTKRYGSTLAVDDLNFTIEKGQIYGFLGPNGAGKSTTMNIITGYIASTDGTVTIDGHDILENPEAAKKNIGYLPELPPLYFDMTVEEYLLFAAELKKIPKKERASQLADICALTKVEEVRHRLIKNLSKGYRQRVGLAQALLGYPEILILDEPTVGLDPKQILEIRNLIKTLGKSHTVILSSHILSEVSAVCDYVLIISHGKLVASDTPDNLSKLMQGTSSLLLTVKSSQEDLENLLNTIPAVQEFHFTDCEEKDCVKAEIKTEPSADIRELLFYRLAEAGLPILGMQLVHLSLEDIFLELTADDTQSFTESASSIDQKGENLDDLHM
ncbi:MAG: ATP-binding cassette domain-containing protein [Hominisplanchenecus sp.]|nr:ABC transporter ATP-binding protein [Lachnospiraceae bacterium]MDY2818635.1 ATP-binding cassette domain-containing protein [Hominisplanchenecus sp.]